MQLCFTGVVTEDKQSLLVIGGRTLWPILTDQSGIYKINCPLDGQCQVETLPQELQIARNRMVAMLVPDSIVNCN